MSAERLARVAALRAARPRSTLLRATPLALGLGAAATWLSGEMEFGRLFERRRFENLARFLRDEAWPAPLRGDGLKGAEPGQLGALWDWITTLLIHRGFEALVATLALAVTAAVLAGFIGLLLGPLCARTLATRAPYAGSSAPSGAPPASSAPRPRGTGWVILSGLARATAVVLRALPEYLAAFLLAAMLPSVAWAAVLALALHNGGILARLYGETYENLPAPPLRAWVDLGASRRQLAVLGLLPLALPRLLLYFFYRFETCVREATVLGMLGFVSLGYWIQDARARLQYDTLLLLVGLGVVIVLAGDLCSYVARAFVRRAT